METIRNELVGLNGAVDRGEALKGAKNYKLVSESEQYGKDVKYLADAMNSTRKFDPWIVKYVHKDDLDYVNGQV